MELRRVVVTGLGIVSPLGCGVEPTWANILAGKSGARRIDDFEVDDLACQIAQPHSARVDYADGKFNPDEWMDPKEQRKVDPFIVYAHGGGRPGHRRRRRRARRRSEEQERTGVLIGSGIGGIGGIYEASITLHEKGPRRIRPFFIPGPPDQSGLRATSRSATASRARTIRWSPPARPARTPSATLRG